MVSLGNYIGGEMYSEGRACSKCPSGTTCSKTYPGLCASRNTSTNEILPRRTTTETTTTTTKRTTTTTRRPATTTRRPTTTTRRPTTTTRRPTTRPRPNSNSNRFTPQRPGPTRPSTTTTPRPTSNNATLFECNFEKSDKECEVRFSGKDWLLYNSATDKFYEIVLESRERSEIFFSNMVSPPKNGVACLSFRYRKFLDGNLLQFYSR